MTTDSCALITRYYRYYIDKKNTHLSNSAHQPNPVLFMTFEIPDVNWLVVYICGTLEGDHCKTILESCSEAMPEENYDNVLTLTSGSGTEA
jgi:hypothetical protein